MSQDARLTLYGRPASKEDIAREVARLYLGNPTKHQQAQNPTQIAKTLGYKQPKSVYNYMDLAVDLGLLKKSTYQENNQTKSRYEKPEVTAATEFERMDSDKFAQSPLIKEWIENMLTKKNGKPLDTWRERFVAFKNFCNTFKLKPEQLIIDKKTFLQILTSCKIEWDKGISYDRTQQRKNQPKNSESAFHFMKMAARDFVQFHGVALPKNIGGIASGKVINHGQYADIRFTLEEIEKGEAFAEEKFGIDSDVVRVLSVGISGGARAFALLNMNCEWSEIPSPLNPEMRSKLQLSDKIFVMKAFETKTQTNWTKYIIRPRAQQSLILHKAKNQFQKIISANNVNPNSFDMKPLGDQLREVYKFLGKEFVHNGYFMRKPFHALRHISAQWWIEISNGNLSLVCDACGWKSDIELRASYGEIPPQMRIKSLGALGA